MNFAAILAGGQGTRMGATDKPKQFQLLAEKPVLIHTLEKFAIMGEFERVLVLCPAEWVEAAKDLVAQHFGAAEKLVVISGGATRNGTVQNAIAWIMMSMRQSGSSPWTILQISGRRLPNALRNCPICMQIQKPQYSC